MRTLIVTVGTSALFNARTHFHLDRAAAVTLEQLREFLRVADPIKASAESNSLSRLLREDDRLIFLHSHTPEGELCAQALAEHYAKLGSRTQLVEIGDLAYSDKSFKSRGLRALVSQLCDLIIKERREDREVAINATGGFKAEIAYATLIGLVFDVPVFYIHEAFRDIIEMPPTPIGWDYSLLANHQEFFEWIDAEPRAANEVETRVKALPERARMLLQEEDDGCVYLSPAGEAFFAAFKSLLDTSVAGNVYLSPQACSALNSYDTLVRAEIVRHISKLQVPQLRHTNSHPLNGSSDCFVSPSKHSAIRAFFYEEGENAYICEITSYYDGSYERTKARGVWRKDYGDFSVFQAGDFS